MLRTLSGKNQDIDIDEEVKGLTILSNESQNWIKFSEHSLKSWNPNMV